MRRVVLARHASFLPRPDSPLTDLVREDTRNIGAREAERPIRTGHPDAKAAGSAFDDDGALDCSNGWSTRLATSWRYMARQSEP